MVPSENWASRRQSKSLLHYGNFLFFNHYFSESKAVRSTFLLVVTEEWIDFLSSDRQGGLFAANNWYFFIIFAVSANIITKE